MKIKVGKHRNIHYRIVVKKQHIGIQTVTEMNRQLRRPFLLVLQFIDSYIFDCRTNCVEISSSEFYIEDFFKCTVRRRSAHSSSWI